MTLYAGNDWVSPAEAGKRVFHKAGKTVIRMINSGDLPQRWPPEATPDLQQEVWTFDGHRYKLSLSACRRILNARTTQKVQELRQAIA